MKKKFIYIIFNSPTFFHTHLVIFKLFSGRYEIFQISIRPRSQLLSELSTSGRKDAFPNSPFVRYHFLFSNFVVLLHPNPQIGVSAFLSFHVPPTTITTKRSFLLSFSFPYGPQTVGTSAMIFIAVRCQVFRVSQVDPGQVQLEIRKYSRVQLKLISQNSRVVSGLRQNSLMIH